MKAPDKIYVAESLIKTPYGNEWSPTPYISREDTEYIRKDALFKKLENVAAEYKKRSDEGELVWQNMCGIKQAIDILNKM